MSPRHPTTIQRLAPWLLLSAVVSGCSLVPQTVMPDAAVPVGWETPPSVEAERADVRWWRRYGSAELDALVAAATDNNHDLAIALSRIDQARASLRVARAAWLPSVGASGSASHSRRRADDTTSTSEDGQAGVTVAYELDLWGANRAASAAADAQLAATVFNRDSVALVLQSDVVTTYFQLLSLRDRLSIAQRNLDAAGELMRLVQVRYDNGAATALDLAQQRTTLLSIQSQIPALEQSLRETRHALAILLGRAPQGFDVDGDTLTAIRIPIVDPGQPADLLSRRPDIRIAEANLIAADADIGAARAAMLPSLDVSAAYTASGLIGGGAATVASVAASLAQTIFAGGRLQAQLRLAEDSREELALSYVQSVLIGLQEVEDGLAQVQTSDVQTELLAQTAVQARESYRLARVQYDAGATDLLTLLDSQRSQLSAEDSLVQAQLTQLSATAQLVKALGGGWLVEGASGG